MRGGMIAEPGRGKPPLFADVWQTKDFKSNDFGCVAKKQLRERFFGCVAKTVVTGGLRSFDSSAAADCFRTAILIGYEERSLGRDAPSG